MRQKTGAGVMECKKILEKNNMDADKAVAELMEIARSSKGRSRNTAAGWISMARRGNKAVLSELLSETDFVSKNENFKALSKNIAQVALDTETESEEGVFKIDSTKLLEAPSLDQKDVTVGQKISELIFSMGETMRLERCEGLCVKEGIVDGYVHGGRIGVLVSLSGGEPNEKLARDIAVHIAACGPDVISREDLPPSVEPKKGSILLEQDYIHDESLTVKEVLEKHGSPKVSMHILSR
eukprot:CAMPEP_0206188822 /NCGR_PEP_ID=MMETSP0166-20121206/3807_1 /ASSEMBLY_ACC=CAM_ASM_000260 /TAXON_ID=95228 /ORGANISM="Vannella robusta, Strain DIVA3 518/3/11/1/6" /LENGTH=238 /DNA_ID=CAMNT_0053604631 /DNA_START=252 /DNA_END=968 /DNA_ORIENTATION=-